MSTPVQHRYDFVYLFVVTDVCLKRKVRNYGGLVHGEKPPYEIYVKERAVLNLQHARAYEALNLDPDPRKRKSKGKDRAEEDQNLTQWMCKNFYGVRTFGAVMSTGVDAGQVRGAVQMTVARSIDRIVAQEHRSPAARSRRSTRPRNSRVTTGPWAESLPFPTVSTAGSATSTPASLVRPVSATKTSRCSRRRSA
jgi:Cas7 group CRISPR-associated protein Csh2